LQFSWSLACVVGFWMERLVSSLQILHFFLKAVRAEPMGEIHTGLFSQILLKYLPGQRVSLIRTGTADLFALAADGKDAVQGFLDLRQEPGLNTYADKNENGTKEKDEANERITDK
ncbi:MAG: hypothetical protein M0023_06615, partial [Desulfobacteraceae bacterium]|nr:hypothetical protein [Desulfobacteraceae bacterium]